MIPTQISLVARLRDSRGDSDWEKFYSLYEKPIIAFAMARSLSEAECHDVLQEIMVKMLRGGFARFDSAKGRFTSFLFHIAECCVIDAIRRRERRHARHVPIDGTEPDGSLPPSERLADASGTPADAAERQSQLALIFVALDFLIERKCFQEKTIGLFKAVTIEQKAPNEVAITFNTSVGNVYEAKRAVLAKLKSVLWALEEGMDLEQAIAEQPAKANP